MIGGVDLMEQLQHARGEVVRGLLSWVRSDAYVELAENLDELQSAWQRKFEASLQDRSD
jgi:hypothetical protein